MHSYIGKNEIVELVQNNRQGFIIENIKAKDIDEYINNLLIVLKGMNISTGIFNQPKIKRLCDDSLNPLNKNKYTLLLVIRKDAKVNNNAYNSIGILINNVVPCLTIQDFVKKQYSR